MYKYYIKVIRKVMKRRHRKPLFGHVGDETSKTGQESTIGFKGAWNSV
jgi:hypothetical protein